MRVQRHTVVWHKLNGALRAFMLHSPRVQSRSLLVNEYPKSGGTWLTRMLADILALPFARNRLPYLRRDQIFHGHQIDPHGLEGLKTVVLWRDGRDVLVSLYYHALFYNDLGNKVAVDFYRRYVPFSDYTDIRANLPLFMEFVARHRGKPAFDWGDFARAWHRDGNSVHLRYEDLFDDTVSSLMRVLGELGFDCDQERVAAVAGRYALRNTPEVRVASQVISADTKVPFVRKGGYGGWKEHFSPEAARLFDNLYGEILVELGYETDHSWVEHVK